MIGNSIFSLILNLKLEVSRKASNQSEDTEYRDEKKLEAIGGESEVVNSNDVITDGRGIGLALGRSGQESRDGGTLLALNLGKTVLVNELGLGLGEAGGSSSGVEGGVTLDLKLGVREVGDRKRGRWGTVSASRDIELDVGQVNGGVSTGRRRGRLGLCYCSCDVVMRCTHAENKGH